jgi:ornithine decarboxylase
MIVEPGALVGNAGEIESEVVLVSRKDYTDKKRWVYLDIGKFGGLAETLDEAIKYPIRSERDGGETGPVILAGPTCDSADILYEETEYYLPIELAIGDKLRILGAGAYTSSYSSVGFNGFPPLTTYVSTTENFDCIARGGSPIRPAAVMVPGSAASKRRGGSENTKKISLRGAS